MRTQRHLPSLLLALAIFASACGSSPESLAFTEAEESTTTQAVAEEQASAAGTLAEPVEPIDTSTTEAPEPAPAAADDASTTTTAAAQAPSTTVADAASPTTVAASTTTAAASVSCTAPAGEWRWVDVALNDPDGGLNIREAAGASAAVQWTMPRNTQVSVTGLCETIGSTDWWEVSPFVEADLDSGWVSSDFLSTISLDPAPSS